MIEGLKLDGPLTPLITIVVITRNRAQILADCLQHILEQNFPKKQYELVVVDDGSTDRTSAVVESFLLDTTLPVIRYVPQAHQGVNAARNAGIDNARGTAVAFIDDDVLIRPDYLLQLWRLFSENPDFDGIGGPLRDFGGSKLQTCSRCSLADTDKPGEGERLAPVLIGGNMALKVSAFRKVGIFDPELSGRGDDSEWFRRAKDLKFFYDPKLWAWHRRDNFSLATLCRHSFVQGLSVPLAKKKIGSTYRPSLLIIARSFVHALRYGCTRGAVLAFREIGSTVGYVRLVTIGR